MGEPSSALAHVLPNAVTDHLIGGLASQQTFRALEIRPENLIPFINRLLMGYHKYYNRYR